MLTSPQTTRFISLTLITLMLVGLISPAASVSARQRAADGARRKPALQFDAPTYQVSEQTGKVKVSVRRTGDTSTVVAVDYSTAKGTASDISDFTPAAGRLRFEPGETVKSFAVLITRDTRREGEETAALTLSAPSGGAELGARSTATLAISDGEQAGGVSEASPIDDPEFFVRQHYRDFLGRDPDADGLAFWVGDITSCGADLQCVEVKRINVSAAFYLSIEFQETGYLTYRVYKSAYGDTTSPNVAVPVPIVRLSEFLPDTQRLGQNVVVNVGDWRTQLEANKNAYMLEFVQRPRFTNAFPATMTNAQFVDKLNQNSGGALSQEESDQLVAELDAPGDATQKRASVLRKVAEDADLRQREFNRAFVLMQYYGYLRRNPDDPQDTDFRGWKFWLDKLNEFDGNFVNAEMVKAFISSIEYRERFGAQSIALTPPRGRQGQTLSVNITGQFTNFIQGITTADFGAGIAVGGAAFGAPGPVVVTSRTTATAQLVISAGAAVGARTVALKTGPERVTSEGGFEVEAATQSITSVMPGDGRQGQSLSVSITGQNTNFAQGTTEVSLGNGVTVGAVTVSSPTALSAQVNIAQNATPGPRDVRVTTGSEEASLANGFTVRPLTPPSVSDFSPKSAPVGTLISVSGSEFAPAPGIAPQIVLNKQGGGTVTAPVSGFSANALTFVLPAGAATGPLTVTVNGQSAASTDPLTVLASSGFSLSAAPAAGKVVRGQSVSYSVTLGSSNGFEQLAALSLEGLPAGVTATFTPQQITAGQSSVLTLSVPAAQAPGVSNFSVRAAAAVDGIALSASTPLTLEVMPITTSFLGRTVVASTGQVPLAGVTVKFVGRDGQGRTTNCSAQTTSDAAGNFSFTNLPSGCAGEQLVRYDGATATSPPGHYAGVDLVYTLVANQATAVPVVVNLPRIDNQETVLVEQNATRDQHFSFASIPGLAVTVYAGTTFTLADGTRPNPFPLTGVQIPVDRLPDSKEPNPTMVMVFIVAFQPANTTANQPVPITFPNTINTAPGTNMVLMTLDPTRGTMVPYGTGTVSNDGMGIVPDLNPATPGKRFGLVHLGWHGQMPPPPPSNQPSVGGPTAGGAVDIASGLEVFTRTDIAFSGGKGGLNLARTYRTLSGLAGPFGIGTSHNYDYRLDSTAPQGAAVVNLVLPDSNRLPFTRQPTGSLLNLTTPALRGAVMTAEADGGASLRFKDGTVFKFIPGTILTGSVLVSITDPNGNTTTLRRDPDRLARILEIADPVGRKLTFAYDFADRVASVADPIGRVARYTYHGNGRLATYTDPAGGVTKYDYDDQNNLSRVTDPNGAVIFENTYDSNGRVSEQVQADGGRTRYSYTTVNPLVATSPVIKTVVTDQLGRKTTYRFNTQSYLTDVTDPTGQTRVYEREAGTNQLLAVRGAGVCDICGDATEGDVSFTYDGSGNVATNTDALGNVTKFTYDPAFNKVETYTDALGNVTRFTYDERGNITSTTDPRGNTTSIAYNGAGQVVETTDATGKKTTLTYDSVGNLIAVRDALGNTTNSRYDAVSRLIEQQDALGNKVTIAYDALDRITSVTDALGRSLAFAYDPVGNLLSLTDPRGKQTTAVYDALRRVTKRTDPLGRVQTYAYDLRGNLKEVVDRRGQKTTMTYDAVNRLLTETFADATVTRSYDGQGRLSRVEDTQGGVFAYAYDAAGRLTRTINQYGTVDYTRDAVGRVKSRQVLGQSKEEFAFDGVGNMTSAAMPQASVAMTYDARNLLQSLTRSNGVSTSYTYDALGRLLTRTHAKGDTNLDTQTYTYDAAGRRVTNRTGLAQPLTTTAAAGQVDDANQLSGFGGRTYTHDANGNRLTETGPEGQTAYTWDGRSRLRSVATPDGRTTSFVYDFSGNLIQQRVTGGGPEMVRSFVLDQLTNVAFQSSSTGEQLSFLTGGGIDDHLAAVDGGGQVRFALAGMLGSVAAHTGAAGTIEGRAFYEPFGKTATAGAAYAFEYSGRYRVAENLYYYRARFYDPVAGRFISEDPIGFLGGSNLYQFNFNDPVNRIDPLGLWAGVDDLIAAGSGALIGVIGKGVSDAFSGELSGWEDYAGAAIGGAVGGEAFLYTGNPFIAGAAGGAAGNLATQGLKNLTGQQCGFDAGSLAFDTGVGTLLGGAPKLKVQGITAGRGSFSAVQGQMYTKLRNGTIRRVSPRTAGKMVTADVVGNAPGIGVGGGADAIGRKVFTPPGCPPKK